MRITAFAAGVSMLLGSGGSYMLAGRNDDGARQTSEYVDPAGRFRFTFPISFGTTSPGTNDGFEDRAAAIRFSIFSSGGIGGEAVVTRGGRSLDLMAAGGLYDGIAREALPDDLRRAVLAVIPALTAQNFCRQIAAEGHLAATSPVLAGLSDVHRQALSGVDRMGNGEPAVQSCDVNGTIVVFEKEAGLAPGGPRRSIYGAVRFLTGAFSSFQIIRAGTRPDARHLAQMREVVASWRTP